MGNEYRFNLPARPPSSSGNQGSQSAGGGNRGGNGGGHWPNGTPFRTMYNFEQAGEAYGVSAQTIRRRVEDGTLPLNPLRKINHEDLARVSKSKMTNDD